MKGLTIEEIHNLFAECSGVSTDSRLIKEGSLFFALKGESFDGNMFAEQAIEKGAKYAVIDAPNLEQLHADKFILVEDVLLTLQSLARYHRLKHRIPILAITGTNGKTTTKELIAATLSAKYRVLYTEGNLNNHIGVPLTLLRLTEQTQVAVIEMGASNMGEIKTLADIVRPSFGLITNIGRGHLLGFGSIEGVIKTKGELYDSLNEHRKIAFVNIDNPILVKMAEERENLHIVPYGYKNDLAKIIENRDGSPYLTLQVPNPCYTAVEQGEDEYLTIKSKLIGEYNADNILAAMCVSAYLDVDTKAAVEAISNYIPSNNRSQLKEGKYNTLIIDAYNANPTSMSASLKSFNKIASESKILILGDMLELGADSLDSHISILRLAMGLNVKRIYLVGGEFRSAYEAIENEELCREKISLFKDSVELSNYLQNNRIEENLILIKGSRGTRLERVIEHL